MITRPTRRLVIAALAASAALSPVRAAPQSAADDPNWIAQAEAYFNELTTLRAEIDQLNPDGSVSQGELRLARPDRLRLQYDRPDRTLIVANNGRLVYHDPTLQQINYLDVDQTPLGLLFDDPVTLNGGNLRVSDIQQNAQEVGISVERRDQPQQGLIQLVFAKAPFELRRWAVTDPQGLVTQVMLEDVRFGERFAREDFVFRDPRRFGGN